MSMNIAQLIEFLEQYNPTTEICYEDPNFGGALLEDFPCSMLSYDEETQLLLIPIPCVEAME